MKTQKKLVDLIYLDSNLMESELRGDYWARINTWIDWMDLMLVKVVNEDIYIEEQSEYFQLNNLLKNFLIRRLEWILESTPDPELRTKYLLALPPFNQRGNVKRFLLHFFQFKDQPNQKGLKFDFLNNSEKEVRILWDIYKLTKTVQTIDILKKHTTGADPFPSSFPEGHIVQLLDSLSDTLKLLVKICVKPVYHAGLIDNFPLECFEPESILSRKETELYMINEMVLEKFDYRNYFFHVYFRSGLKAIYKGKDLTYKFNYLDFEIIRQEFLIHWIDKRLANNPRKNEVLKNYNTGRKSFLKVIEKTPELEITLLKRLPKHVFDDLMADINESVAENDKSPIDPMSEQIGEFARQFKLYEKAKKIAAKSIKAIRGYLLKSKTDGDQNERDDNTDNQTESTLPEAISKSKMQVKILKKSEIDYPYFCTTNSEFSRQVAVLQTKTPAIQFTAFNNKVKEYLSRISESSLIKRRTPRHEWAVPFLIQEVGAGKETVQLLILGAEVKSKQLSMGYGSDLKKDFDFKTYFVYGALQEQHNMGSPAETRKVKGRAYQIYNFTNPAVIDKVMNLIEVVIKT